MKQIFILIFILIISSCDGVEKTSDKQAPNTHSTQLVDSSSKSQVQPSETERAHTGAYKDVNSLNGSQVVENSLNKLKSKLGLTDQQQTDTKAILTQTFLGMGEDLNKSYTSEQSRILMRDMIQKSTDQIMAILDENQKDLFKRFGQH